MNWIEHTLKQYPELTIFLALVLGNLIGKPKYKSFTLGSVTGVLLAGLGIGMLVDVSIAPVVKSTFFLLFLFAVGFNVGPQFFNSLRKEGLPQMLFAAIVCVLCLLVAWGAAKVCGFDLGLSAGLYAGASTISAAIGVAQDTINQLPGMTAEQKLAQNNAIPIAYAVTYVFGTIGSAWILSWLAPKLLRIDLAQASQDLEKEMGADDDTPGVFSAYDPVGMRAYKLEHPELAKGTVAQLEEHFREHSVFVERIRRDGQLIEAEEEMSLKPGDVLALGGTLDGLVQVEDVVGHEVDDRELLNFPAETLDVVVTKREICNKTLIALAEAEQGKPGRGVFVKKITRGGVELPVTGKSVLHRGDVMTFSGAKRDVERAAARIGYADRATNATDVLFLAAGVLLGALFGALSFKIGGVPISLSTSGGALVAGLVCGWLRATNRRFGRIPAPAIWVFNNIGLAVFIAVVGITAGPSFIAGVKQSGVALLLAGVAVTTIPLILGLYIGKWFFKMPAPILIGALAGARTTTAALGAILDAAKSKVPSLGYTVTYAVGNTLLIIWGVVIVLMMT